MASDPRTFRGKFSAAGSAATLPVQGELRDEAVVFWPEGTSAADDQPTDTTYHVWHYDRLTTTDSLRPGDPDVLIHYPDSPGATLFVESGTFVTQLAARAEQTTPAAWFWRFVTPALAIVAVLVAIVGTIYTLDLSPAKALARLMPQDVREQLGRSLFSSLTKDKYATCSSTTGDAALAKMSARLKRGGDIAFTAQVVDWNLENAFALPGGKIVLTRGLLEGAASAEEVAGVLAHEIGHVVELHPETGIVRVLGLTVAAQFIFTGGAETAGNLGTVLVALRFNRQAETEADTIALQIMEEANVDPAPLAGFFERMLKRQGFTLATKTSDDKKEKKEPAYLDKGVSRSLEMFSTHPQSASRVRKIKKAASYSGRPVLTDAEWKALREICK